jgi:hypothetical protein
MSVVDTYTDLLLFNRGGREAKINSALSVLSVVKFVTQMQLTADFFQQTAKVFTVSELTRSIRGTLHLSFRAKSRNL